jgi:hypothetical protein
MQKVSDGTPAPRWGAVQVPLRKEEEKMRKKVIASLMILLSTVSTFVFIIPMAHSSRARIVVYPSGDTTGVTDADSIEWALQNVAPGGKVQLKKGHYFVSRSIMVEGFSGTFIGKGMDKTIIEAVRKSDTEGFALGTHPITQNKRSKLLWFYNPTGYLRLKDLSFQVLDPQPSEPYQAYWAEGDISALTSFFHAMGGDCEIVVKNIRMTGAESEADGNFHGMNIAWPCQRHSGGGVGVPVTGDLTIKACVFEKIGGVVIDLMHLSGCTVTVSRVETYDTQGVYLEQGGGMGLEPSTFIFTHNNFRMFPGHNFAGIEIWNPSGHPDEGVQHEIVISHNTFHSPSCKEPYAAIFAKRVSGAVVANNIITGAGESAINVEPWGADEYGDWILYNNDVSGFDAELAAINLGPATRDCIVVGGIGYSEYVFDQGTDNVILELDEDDLEDWEDYFDDDDDDD